MNDPHRSGCPINLTLEVLGDAWSLIVIRDVIFGNRRHFRDLLVNSEEGISSNILADRLKSLVENGVLTRADDPTHKQKAIYSLTGPGIEFLPIIAAMSAWGLEHQPVSYELSVRAQILRDGGPRLIDAFMDELRETHLGVRNRRRGPTVGEKMQAAYQAALAKRKRS